MRLIVCSLLLLFFPGCLISCSLSVHLHMKDQHYYGTEPEKELLIDLTRLEEDTDE